LMVREAAQSRYARMVFFYLFLHIPFITSLHIWP